MITWNNMDSLASYAELTAVAPLNLAEAMTGEAGAERVKNYTVPMGAGMDFNFGARPVNDEILAVLAKFAQEQQLAEKFAALYNGEVINTGEKRRVLHHMCRGQLGEAVIADGVDKREFYLEQQKKIAEFLDAKCSEIDALVADIQAQIETLEQYKRSTVIETVTKGLNGNVPMKNSGIQWIGQIPETWDCIRGKYILKYITKPTKDDDGVITCFRDGEVTLRSNRREEGFTMADKEIGYQGIDVGDLVVHGMDGFAGSIGISDSRGKASPVLNVLDTEQNKRYIMYYLRSMAYNDVFVALATGIRVRSCDLRWNKLAELLYPMPPVEEQQAIVEHIDSVLERTNAIIADKKQQIETIEEYKKSLIFEYVTGKKEVVNE